MAVLKASPIEGKGSSRGLRKGSEALLMRTMQGDQYKYPIKSFIRETVSNCLDSIREKNNSIAILTGKAKETDFYVEDTGDDSQADSRFDRDYYDVSYLNKEDIISIDYIERKYTTRDLIRITDSGVGLGPTRLEGYFDLGYSTKRLNKEVLGCFGLGSKSALAPGAESFRLITIYNGFKYMFDVYNDIFVSITPPFAADGTKLDSIVIQEEVTFFEPTTEKNSVTIELEIKNPIKNKKHYVNAVRDQLTYFDFVTFKEYQQDRKDAAEVFVEEISFKTDVLYEDDRVILPRSTTYTKPHLILSGVVYGMIDFPEMEMAEIYTCVGIKGNINDIDVTPGRESVIYNQKTRKAMEGYLVDAGVIAEREYDKYMNSAVTDVFSVLDYITAETLEEDDALEVAQRLSKLAGRSMSTKINLGGRSFKKSELAAAADILPLYHYNYKGERVSENTLKSIGSKRASATFVFTQGTDTLGKIATRYLLSQGASEVYELREGVGEHKFHTARSVIISELLNSGCDRFLRRDQVVIPEGWAKEQRAKLAQEEAEQVKKKELSKLTPAQRRKLSGKVVVSRHRFYRNLNGIVLGSRIQKKEVTLQYVADKNAIVGTKEHFERLGPMFVRMGMNGEELHRNIEGYTDSYIVAAPVLKDIMSMPDVECTTLLEIVRGTDNDENKIKMNNHIKKQTVSLLREELLPIHTFLRFFTVFDNDACEAYKELKDSGLLNDTSMVGEVAEYLKRMAQIQLDLSANIKKKDELKNIIGADLEGIEVIDLPGYIKVEALALCVTNVATMLGMVKFSDNNSPEEVDTIREYLKFKGYTPYKECLKLTKNKYND